MGLDFVIELDEYSIYYFENKKNYQSERKKWLNRGFAYDFKLHISESECKQIYYEIIAIRERIFHTTHSDRLYSGDNALQRPFDLSAIIIPGLYLHSPVIHEIKTETFVDPYGNSSYKGIIVGDFLCKKTMGSVWREV